MYVSFFDRQCSANPAAPAQSRTSRLRVRTGVALGLAGLLGWFAGCQTRNYPSGFIGTITGEGQVAVAYLGDLATLTATVGAGWRFDHWQGPGDYATENPHTVGAVRVPYYTAVFVAEDVSSNGDTDSNSDENDNVNTNGSPNENDNADTNGATSTNGA